jgi:hypothetical protein
LSPTTRRDVAAAIAQLLADQEQGPLVGVSSLAEGADQLFAFAVLAAGGQLHAVIPSQGYEQTFATPRARSAYAALLLLAEQTTTMPFAEPSEDAFLAAGHEVADGCDLLIAVWDGRQAAGKGGTGDIVNHARARGREICVVWPDGARRT